MFATPFDDNRLGWLLDKEFGELPGVRFALHITSDGLLRSRTSGIGKDAADLAAGAMASLAGSGAAWAQASGAALEAAEVPQVRQVLVETGHGLGLCTAAARNSLLVVCADTESDVGVIGHRMTELAGRMGEHMDTPDRVAEGPER